MTGAAISSKTSITFPAGDITPWTGETADDVLAAGAGEYSVADARAIVKRFAEVTTSLHVDTFVEGFTPDCVTSFNEFADMKGREALRQFMEPRFERLAEAGSRFLCRKALRSLTGSTFGVVWFNEWIDPHSNKPMRAKGLEFWLMKSGQIARWDCCTAIWAA